MARKKNIPVYPSYELASYLAEEYNSYASYMEEFHEIEPDTVLNFLHDIFDNEDLKFLIDDTYGHALIMGTIHTLLAIRAANEAIAEDEDEN